MRTRSFALLLGVASLAVTLPVGAEGQGRGRGGPVDATVELALGPSWYQTEKKYVLAKGDQIDVVGAKSSVQGREVLHVREIKKGSETMTFRDATGFPMWAGGGRR